MSTFIAWGNIHQSYPFDEIPLEFLPIQLTLPSQQNNARIEQRWHCRRLAHFLLWRLLKMTSMPISLLGDIYRTPTGRPQFPLSTIDFNISHSGDWVAVVLNVQQNATDMSQCAVGIDIEFPKKNRPFSALLTHFASENEQHWFTQQPDPEAAFYQIWCLREAILKSQGVGIVKLSEVCHDPITSQLHSVHSPKGRLNFTATLPFYLAVFAAENALQQAQYFQWDNEQLNPIHLPFSHHYLVNF